MDPHYYVLVELLQRRLFRVPDYQRTYSWEKKQREDLFEDIKKLQGSAPERHHFMATIVCLKDIANTRTIGDDTFTTLKIVDGQQRLTTLIILLKAIHLNLNIQNVVEREAANNLAKLLVKADNRAILLQTNHSSVQMFSEYLLNGTKPALNTLVTSAHVNMYNAFTECEGFVREWRDGGGDIVDLLKIIKNQLGFITYEISDEGAVYTVFEVLNSRGIEVDWLDKTKSMLMGIVFERSGAAAPDHLERLHQTWSIIYTKLGTNRHYGEQALRFAATLKKEEEPSKPLSSEDSYNFFRARALGNPNDILHDCDWLKNVTEKLIDVYSNSRLSAVADISQARLLAIAIHMTTLEPGQKEAALKLWEKTTFKIYGLGRKDARTKVGAYVRLAHKTFNTPLTLEQIRTELKSISDEYPITSVINGMKKSDLYDGWEDDLRYFLYRYEEYLCREAGIELANDIWNQIWSDTPSTTIEHIYPQKPSPNWDSILANQQKRQVNRIGNLILLPPGLNSQSSQRPFNEKKVIYRQNQLQMHNTVLRCRAWGRQQIEDRETKLLEWAATEWGD